MSLQLDFVGIGKWSSSGGESKLFSNSEFSLKWYGPSRKKLLIINDDEEEYLRKSLISSAIDTTSPTTTEVLGGKNTSCCRDCDELRIEMAEVKLELTMLCMSSSKQYG